MSTTTTIIVIAAVVAVVLLVIAAIAAIRARQRARLREQFGTEYDRTLDDAPNRRTAERTLRERAERHEELDIRPLDPVAATRYREQWGDTQARFVDSPAESVAQAHALVTSVMRERGYPTSDDDERASMLSVDHADVMDSYRAGMRTEDSWRSSGNADTEELRQAMQHYRSVFERLVGETADAYPSEGQQRTTARLRR